MTGIYFLASMFISRSNMPFEFLVLAMTFTVCVTTLVSTGNVIKNLYMNGDNELLLRFPVSGKEILLSKSIYCFVHNVVINLLIMIPVCVIYGVVASAPVGYYFVALAVTVLAIPLPYAIANILAIPVMMVMNLVKNQFLLVLILLIAAICGVFILYMTALSGVLQYMRDESAGMFSPEVIWRCSAIWRIRHIRSDGTRCCSEAGSPAIPRRRRGCLSCISSSSRRRSALRRISSPRARTIR